MGGFITSRSSVNRHGVFAEERRPPAIIAAIGTGTVLLVGQFPWGPDDQVIEPTDPADRGRIIAPPGMDRTGSGYLATIRKGFANLHLVRAIGSGAVKAEADLADGVPTDIITVEAKYKGTAGNDIVCTVSAASDDDSDHFNLTVSVTGQSGTTEDIFENLNYSGTGDDSTPDLTQARLVGAITKITDGRPANGDTNLAGGLDGTIDSGRYIGTAGAPDHGLSLAENDKAVRVVFADDCGDSLRAAVNAGLQAHALLMGDRIAVINGNSGQTPAAARTDVANYRSTRVVYADPWVRVFDDVDGTKRLVNPASFVASVISQVSPSTSPAWKDGSVIEMLSGIVELETPRGSAAGGNSKAGIATIIKEEEGGFSIEAGVLTIRPNDEAKRNITRTRIGDYIAVSVTRSLRSSVDAPNVPVNQQEIVMAIDRFLSGLKKSKDRNPNNEPHILDYEILPLSASNPQVDLDNGDFTVAANIKTSSAMERIFFSVQYGETVQVQAA